MSDTMEDYPGWRHVTATLPTTGWVFCPCCGQYVRPEYFDASRGLCKQCVVDEPDSGDCIDTMLDDDQVYYVDAHETDIIGLARDLVLASPHISVMDAFDLAENLYAEADRRFGRGE